MLLFSHSVILGNVYFLEVSLDKPEASSWEVLNPGIVVVFRLVSVCLLLLSPEIPIEMSVVDIRRRAVQTRNGYIAATIIPEVFVSHDALPVTSLGHNSQLLDYDHGSKVHICWKFNISNKTLYILFGNGHFMSLQL